MNLDSLGMRRGATAPRGVFVYHRPTPATDTSTGRPLSDPPWTLNMSSSSSEVGGDGGGAVLGGDSTPKSRIISDALTCGLCLEPFTDETGLRMPLSLPCGHCFCKSCLAQLHKKECPNDRKRFSSVDTLPRNFPLLDIVSSAAKLKASSPGSAVSDLSTAELEEELERRKNVAARIAELTGVLGEQAKHEAELSTAYADALAMFQAKRGDLDKAAADLEKAIETRVAEVTAVITAEMRLAAEAETTRLVTLWSSAAKEYEASKAALQDQRSAIAQIREQLVILGSSSSGASKASPSPSPSPGPSQSNTSSSPFDPHRNSPSLPPPAPPSFIWASAAATPNPRPLFDSSFQPAATSPSGVWGPGTFAPFFPGGAFGAAPLSPRLRSGDGRALGQRHRSLYTSHASASSSPASPSTAFNISPPVSGAAQVGSIGGRDATVGVGVVGVETGTAAGAAASNGGGAGAGGVGGNPFHCCACLKCGGAGMGSGGFIFGRKKCECVPNLSTAAAGAEAGTGAGAGAEAGRCSCGKSLFDRANSSATATPIASMVSASASPA